MRIETRQSVGSSPLVRGALKRDSPDVAVARIIPARAGSTGTSEDTTRQDGDHPRSCGEDSGSIAIAVVLAGIIPARAGSTPLVLVRQRHDRGIIPARAGSTSCGNAPSVATRDHPRSCGEHDAGLREAYASAGIIPARAGSTVSFSQDIDKDEDHPRSCGEHPRAVLGVHHGRGSSPLVRGAHFAKGERICQLGIIPARAGSTLDTGRHAGPRRDHPRSCGEHYDAKLEGLYQQGSSPLVRGAHPLGVHGVRPRGIIPARAGST